MRFICVTWPIFLAVWGCVLPALFLTKIDDLIRNHTVVAVLRIYGQSALLYLPLLLLTLVVVLVAAVLLRALFPKRSWLQHVSTINNDLARIFVVGSLIFCADIWLHAAYPGLKIPALIKAVIVAAAILGSLASARRSSKPGQFLAMFRFTTGIAAATAVFALLTVAFSRADAPSAGRPLAATRGGGGTARPADIVLITVDALSAQHTSVYGARRETTPRLQELAAQALVFDRFYANGNWTQTGVSSILSGRRPWTTNADNLNAGPERAAMGGSLLETAHRAGYCVLTVTTNFNATPQRQKVEQWVDDSRYPVPGDERFLLHFLVESKLHFSGEAADQESFMQVLRMIPQPLLDRLNGGVNLHFNPQPAVDAAEQLWEQHSDCPRFLWLHLMPPHGPYATPEPFLGQFGPGGEHDSYWTSSTDWEPLQWFGSANQQQTLDALADRYDEAVLYSDHYVGAWLDWLRGRGDFDRSLVIVTADHGESFHHGYGNHGGVRLYDEVVHIPLLIKMPFQIEGQRQKLIAEQVDLAPTLAHLLAVDAPSLPYEGKVLSLAADDAATIAGPPAFSMSLLENPDPARLSTGSIAMIDGPYKFVHYFGDLSYPHMPVLHDELYNLADDAPEAHSLGDEMPDVRDKMLGEIQKAIETHGRGPHVE